MKIGYLMQAGVPEVRYPPYSGPAHHVRRVIQELQALGNEVTLLARLDGCLWLTSDLENFERAVVPGFARGPLRLVERFVRRVQSELSLPYLGWFESQRFAAACRRYLTGCQVLYERMGWMGYGGVLAARAAGIPHVLEVNGDHLSELEMLGVAPAGLQRIVSLRQMRQAIHKTTYVVATGDGWRDRFMERWQFDPGKIQVIENGSTILDYLPREALQCFHPQPETAGPVTMAYVGAFEPWHGVPILLNALAKSVAANLEIKLTLIGTGTELPRVRHLIETLNLHEKVDLRGHLTLEETARQLATAEIGVSPYCGRSEYSGLKLLDYKAAGLATIASGENGRPQVIKDGHTGLIVPPCDDVALFRAIQILVKDPGLRRTMGQTARAEAERSHSWRDTSQQLVRIFQRLA